MNKILENAQEIENALEDNIEHSILKEILAGLLI
jgi:hypothetical protein